MNDFSDIQRVISKARRFALIGHIQPDGDCIGSVLAMRLLLQAMGKEVYILSENQIPDIFTFLPGARQYIYPEDIKLTEAETAPDYMPEDGPSVQWQTRSYLKNCDVLLTLDISTPQRLGPSFSWLLDKLYVINFDHHLSNTQFGHINLIADISSTGELVYRFIKHLQAPLNESIAECLYTAVIMDTNNFRYSCTTAATHQAAAEMIASGVDISKINEKLFEEKPLESIRLLTRALQRLHISECGRVAWITVTLADMAAVGADEQHISNIIDYTRCIAGIEVGILFRELQPGLFKVGFRSKNVDVNQLAAQFGGGGHKRAAGCQMSGELENVGRQVVKAAQKMCREYVWEISKEAADTTSPEARRIKELLKRDDAAFLVNDNSWDGEL